MKKWLYWIAPFAILIVLVAWRFQVKKSDQAQAGGGPPRQGGGGGGGGGGPAPVQVASAGPRLIIQTVQVVGNLESPYKIEISPKSTGRIDYLQAREGDAVTPGEVLVKIDPSDLKGAEVQAEANVAEARSKLAQAQLTTGATDVGISSQIRQMDAALASAQADYAQVQSNAASSVAAAQAQVDGANQNIKAAQASLEKEKANLLNAQSHYNRAATLYAKDFISAQALDDAKTAVTVQQGVVSVAQTQLSGALSQLKVQQEGLSIAQRKGRSDVAASKAKLDQAKASQDLAHANRSQAPAYRENIAALKSQLDAAVAGLREAQSRLNDTVLRSTISGAVTARKADPGGLATPGSPVLEVQFLDWLYVSGTVPVELAPKIHEGQQADITIDALPGKTFSGPIINLNEAADSQSRQFGIKVKLDNSGHAIRPGMYARISVVTDRVDAPVVVPREALVTSKQDNSTTVVVVDGELKAHIRPVTLGVTDDKGSQILSGVQSGDKVVVLTYNPIKDGQKVVVEGASAKGKGGGGGGGRRRGRPQ